MEKLVSDQTIAELLEITPEDVKKLAKARKIPCTRLNYRTWRYNPAKVQAALARLEVKEVK